MIWPNRYLILHLNHKVLFIILLIPLSTPAVEAKACLAGHEYYITADQRAARLPQISHFGHLTYGNPSSVTTLKANDSLKETAQALRWLKHFRMTGFALDSNVTNLPFHDGENP